MNQQIVSTYECYTDDLLPRSARPGALAAPALRLPIGGRVARRHQQ